MEPPRPALHNSVPNSSEKKVLSQTSSSSSDVEANVVEASPTREVHMGSNNSRDHTALQAHFDRMDIASGEEEPMPSTTRELDSTGQKSSSQKSSSSRPISQAVHSKSVASQRQQTTQNFQAGVESPYYWQYANQQPVPSSSSAYHRAMYQVNAGNIFQLPLNQLDDGNLFRLPMNRLSSGNFFRLPVNRLAAENFYRRSMRRLDSRNFYRLPMNRLIAVNFYMPVAYLLDAGNFFRPPTNPFYAGDFRRLPIYQLDPRNFLGPIFWNQYLGNFPITYQMQPIFVEQQSPSFQDYLGIRENVTSENIFLQGEDTASTCNLRLNIIKDGDLDQILRNFQLFKQFDSVEEKSGHYFEGCTAEQPTRTWLKRIQEEWKILEENLPDKIYVRVYESQVDHLRAVISGADGTPYHDGLFFFDALFAPNHPYSPPDIIYLSHGLGINPNISQAGRICVSLLNTWTGYQTENWIPRKSTMLQVLVSIQGLILNEKPYFNETRIEGIGTTSIEELSQMYNESVFILSLKTMSYTIRKPPKHFEDFVVGHFHSRAHDILAACKAYMGGVPVGSFVKGRRQDVDGLQSTCSEEFKRLLDRHMKTLVKDFQSIGVRNCEKFLE